MGLAHLCRRFPELFKESASFEEVTVGRSADQVYKCAQSDGDSFIKIATTAGSIQRLHYEKTMMHNAPETPEIVLYSELVDAEDLPCAYLVTRALSGVGAHDVSVGTEAVITMAQALQRLHKQPLPFNTKVQSRWVERLQKAEQQLLQRPLIIDEPVFTHGDACLPNFILKDSASFSGWVDLGRAGIFDRWFDLALFCRSLKYNGYSDAQVSHGLAIYGVSFDQQKYDYYNALDKCFS